MANFIPPTNPKFNTKVRKLETNDPVHADVFNTLAESLFDNECALEAQKAEIDDGANTEDKTWSAKKIDEELANLNTRIESKSTFISSNTEPENKNTLWIDTANGGIIKYYDTTTKSWQTVKSVWG